LLTAVEADPRRVLGRDCVDQFGARLPFLLKLLAVNGALSIQVHPSPAKAAAGFAREQAAGVPQARRSYLDPFAKPEMLVSVSKFVGLAGLRHHGQVARMLERLNVPALRPVLDALRLQAGPAGSAEALAILATWPQAQRSKLADAIYGRADLLLAKGPASFDEDERTSLEWVLRLGDQHHDDPLIVAPLILRLHQLVPGEAMYLPAGVAHSYLSGVGIEIMGASDNVVRGGLTTKRIDGKALIEILDAKAQPLLNLAPATVGVTETRWQPPVPEFALSRVVVNGPPVTLAREHGDLPGPEVLLCLRGDVTVSSPARAVRLRGGTSAFLAACTEPAVIEGVGEIFRATVGSMTAVTR
jgi:mannose-6-phosphate isomerase